MLIEAHRGYSCVYPENTLVAFKAAIDAGVNWIELDVHETLDGDFVVMHDVSVDRTTDGSGMIRAMTTREIRFLDAGAWKGPEYAGQGVPTLRDALMLTHVSDVHFNIEVKEMSRGSRSAEHLAGMLAEFRPRDGSVHVVSSFNRSALREVQSTDPAARLACLEGKDAECALKWSVANGMAWLNLHLELADERVVEKAHDHRLRVMIWTLDEPAQLNRYAALGVDKVCTNNPACMLDALRCLNRGSASEA